MNYFSTESPKIYPPLKVSSRTLEEGKHVNNPRTQPFSRMQKCRKMSQHMFGIKAATVWWMPTSNFPFRTFFPSHCLCLLARAAARIATDRVAWITEMLFLTVLQPEAPNQGAGGVGFFGGLSPWCAGGHLPVLHVLPSLMTLVILD